MKKLRDFFLAENCAGEFCNVCGGSPWQPSDKDDIHVRTVDPAFDALLLEMVETLEKYKGIITTTKLSDGSYSEASANTILAKYDAYVRGEKK